MVARRRGCAGACASSRRPGRADSRRARQRRQQRLGGDARIGMDGVMDRHLVAELAGLDVDLRDDRARRDQLAALGGPVREAGAEAEDEIALGDQFVGRRRGESAADADRPGMLRKQPVAAHRRREQRADAIGQRDQRLLRTRRSRRRARQG